MNALTKSQRGVPPQPASRELVDLIARFSSAIEEIPGQWRHRAILDTYAPKGAERQVLEARREALNAALTPADPDFIGRSISALKSAFPYRNEDSSDVEKVKRLYIAALQSFPEWAISEACRRFLEGRVGNRTFAPTPPELAAECRSILVAVHEEAGKIDRILEAQVYRLPSPEQQRRIEEGFAKLRDELLSQANPEKRRDDAPVKQLAETSQRLVERELAAAGIGDGLNMSLALRNKMAGIRADLEAKQKLAATPSR